MKKWFTQFGVEELERPAQRPQLTATQHLWDKLVQRLRARLSSNISILLAKNDHRQTVKSCRKPSKKSCKRGNQLHINAYGFRMGRRKCNVQVSQYFCPYSVHMRSLLTPVCVSCLQYSGFRLHHRLCDVTETQPDAGGQSLLFLLTCFCSLQSYMRTR